MKLLQKISWKFRKLHITISPLIILINNTWEGWGFDILNIQSGLREYSLLKMTWELPNGADKKLKFSGDVLFLRTPSLKLLEQLGDLELWSQLSKSEKILLSLLNLIFR